MDNIAKTISKQREFFSSHKTKDIGFRLENLKKLYQAVKQNETKILRGLKEDLGKSEFEGYATEIGIVLNEIRCHEKNLRKWAKPKKATTEFFNFPSTGRIYFEPYGVALIISPWNYPFQLLMAPLIGAISAGNCVILKPSELSPATTNVIIDIIKNNFADEYIACFDGGPEVSQALLKEKFDYIFFTGSTNVGKIVMSAAAKNLTPVTLELGGKSPVIICDDADLKVTAKRIAWGKFINAGQTCIAPDYILVQKSIKPKLIEELKRAINDLYGNNIENNPEYCKIINQRHFDRLKALMARGEVLFGGQTDQDKLFISPTIIDRVDSESPIMQEEIFGPLLPILEYDNLDITINFINSRPKPLALYVFSGNSDQQEKILSMISSGGACINDTITHITNANLPFGGVGESGMGSYHGRASFDIFSHKKSVLKKTFWPDISFRYPPYTGKSKWLKKIL